ncbi:MAG: magnesium-translocating P-type ATPase [Myxococcaceae bacterium]
MPTSRDLRVAPCDARWTSVDQTSIADPGAAGLSAAQAEELLAREGPNEVAVHTRASVLRQLVSSASNPLLGILLVCAVASAILGQRVNATIVVSMVLLSAGIDFVQSFRSARAVERLRAQVAPTATVLRDGRWLELPRRALVPGDRIRLSAGDMVPADARLVSARTVHVVEAALTGESLPVEKEVGAGAEGATVSAGHVYAGTSIASGSAEAVVERTGSHTQLGMIAARLAEHPPQTAFEHGIRDFGLFITRTVLFLVLFIGVVSVALHRPPLESLLFAVALAVGLTPEFLPMISTVTLATGAMRMARSKVIVKHLPSIQNLGSMDVLCSDKTGTLTRAQMVLERSVDGAGETSPAALRLARVNSALQTGLRSPLDDAILAAPGEPVDGWRRQDEVPFDFERRRLSVAAERDGGRVLVCKGAPESVLAACSAWETAAGAQPLDADARARCLRTDHALAVQGLRVLAVASRPLGEDESCDLGSERDLSFVGFVAFLDPPLADVAATVAGLRRDGVTVKILSGDDPRVVRHVCEAVGIDGGEVLTGDDVDRLTDPALGQVAERTSVFARVAPQQKNRILQALRRRGHVVGFLGDGINDAPSLHAADVGISVATAVDVARDAADIVLLERSLGVLHAGIVEGRKSFGNVMKYLLMGTSSNFGNMLSMAVASVFLPFLPMLPTQILLNNFLYDLAQVTIPTDAVDPSALARPQRWDIGAVRRFMLVVGPVSSLYDFLTFFILLRVFHAPERLFHTGWFVESLATQVLVVFVIRTAGNPLRSRPSLLLATTAIAVVVVAAVLPWTRAAEPLGFEPLPAPFFLFLAVATATYLLLVQWVKARMLPRFTARRRPGPAPA